MADYQRPAASDGVSPVPRRTLRKGTRSCGECKRRKVRCFFERPSAPVCVGCQRRGTACISQEYIDVPSEAGTSDGSATAERLRRVEFMLEKIASKVLPDTDACGQQSTSNEGSASQASTSQRNSESEVDHTQSRERLWPDSPTDTIPAPQDPGQVESFRSPSSDYLTQPSFLSQALYSHFPPQRDLDLIVGEGRSALFIQSISNSYHELFVKGEYHPPKTISQIPPITAHPIVLARKLIYLALSIQQLPPDYDTTHLTIGPTLRNCMKRYIEVTQSLVVCRDDLVDSLEGLECLNCMGVYLMNDGKLRQALPSLRRASVLAQFMGAHRGASSIKIKQHDPATKISLEMTWAHLNYCERYVSLLIGMPSPLMKGKFAAPTKPDHETDGEWLEKVHIDICKLVILRNQDDNRYNLVMTHEIDQQLNDAASSLAPEFWEPLYLTPGMAQVDLMSRIISSMSQIIHYHLLTVLHMPFLHMSTTDHRYDQSKTTCLFACREVLSRFVSFRRIVNIVFCCRWVDFTAFTASMTLLLAHLTFPQQRSGWMLAHQRPSDRALISRAMETMDTLNTLNGDELSKQTALTVRRLLHLEEASSNAGDSFQSSIAEHDDEVYREDFRLDIPYFGSISLVRAAEPIASLEEPTAAWSQSHSSSSAQGSDVLPVSTVPQSHPALLPTSEAGLLETAQMLGHHSLQPLPSNPNPIGSYAQPFQINYQSVFATNGGGIPHSDLAMTDVMASGDEWAFQGVDAAFFESFLPIQTFRPNS